MFSNRYTPGPWKVQPLENGIEADVIDSEGFFVALCMGSAGIEGAENALANAQLIATAPKLMEALAAISAAYEDQNLNHVDFRVFARQTADAAIADATAERF